METVFEGSGKSFEEALDAACKAAGVSLAEVDDKDIQILEHGSKGFFGFGSKNAKIQIIVHSACQEKTIIPQKETVKKVIKETAQEDIKKNIKEAMGEEKTSNCLDNQEIVDEKIKQAVQTALNFLSFIFEK
ncbi:MAG: Jag N-terminal domain-containing protein, partial [Clostridiales bacterium]